MQAPTIKAYVTLIVALAGTSLWLALPGDITNIQEPGLTPDLPDRICGWRGYPVLFCQNEDCGRTVSTEAAPIPDVCPECGGVLEGTSRAEKALLPDDTAIMRKRYVAPSGEAVTVAAVIMGADRTSIHRPQMCLEFQGHRIVREEVLSIPLAEGPPLKAMHLDLGHALSGSDARERRQGFSYTYWFTGSGKATPYFMRMQIEMAIERIFRNTAHRWAYVSVLAPQRGSKESSADHIAFVAELWSLILL